MTTEEKLSRRDREKRRQRQDMLDAALELFSQNGYHNVSMNEIAEKAEFAVGTLYKFFSNKEDLYKSLMLENSERFHSVLTKALNQGDDEVTKLRDYVRAKGEVFMENASVVRLYHAETRGLSFNVKAGFDVRIRQQYDQLQLELAAVFAQGMQKGIFRKIAEPFHLAVALNSIVNSFLLLWLEEPEKHCFPEDPNVILNIFFEKLLES